MRNQLLFQVTNHHGEACGMPPHIHEQPFSGVYRGYFENQNSEQAVFLYDYEQERGILYMGDAGWEHPYAVVDGKIADFMLDRPEQLWLSACWEASGALKSVRAQKILSVNATTYHHQITTVFQRNIPRIADELAKVKQEADRLLLQQDALGAATIEACTFLAKMRSVYEKIDERGAWADYITALRQQNRNLPALKDELAKAKL